MCWNPVFILLILTSTVLDYTISKHLHRSESQTRRRRLLLLSIATNLGILFYFKYYNFLVENLQIILETLSINATIPSHSWFLPVGISFYTFQTLSYTIDIYKRQNEPESNFLKFALYVSFFPQLVAGPIERPQNLLPQFEVKQKFKYSNISSGCKLILWGLFKKLVIADRLSLYVDQVYSNPDAYYGMPIILATVFFVFQVYCDFSGYTDMALGSARLMGYKLMDNFKGPLLSTSMTEFYRRWHISLSTWIRDYVYTPLGLYFREIPLTKRYILVFIITFVLFGFWHGANWTFIVFGLFQGIILSIETRFRKQRKYYSNNYKLFNLLGWISTIIFWTFSCLLFRSNNINDSFTLIASIFDYRDFNFWNINIAPDKVGIVELKISLFFCLILIATHFIEYKTSIIEFLNKRSYITRHLVYFLLISSVIIFGEYGSYKQFIYFQF